MIRYTFISYTHEDTEFALKLARHLKKQDVAVQIDQWNILPDDEWDQAIEELVRNCNHFLMILSPAAINSWIVREQFTWALEMEKSIIPVVYQSCQLPSQLQDIPYIDFTHGDHKKGLKQLSACYFPDQLAESDKWLPNIGTRSWLNTLLSRRWLAWLASVIVALLLVFGAIFYWQADREAAILAQPKFETLDMIESTPTPTPIITDIRTIDNQIMIKIPEGEFFMGSNKTNPNAGNDEIPKHRVYLDTFWIDRTEITKGQYQECVEAGVCSSPQIQGIQYQQCAEGGLCSPLELEEGVLPEYVLPVGGVTWEQAKTYCKWAGARLPTEAEWEKTARGTGNNRYPWGNKFDGERLNYCDKSCTIDAGGEFVIEDGYPYMAPIGSYPAGASPYGVLDMSGNLWEWTADWYDVEAYDNSTYKNPVGPDTGLQRVVRGGSWNYGATNLSVTRRNRDTPTLARADGGFRCVVSETVNSDP